MRVGRGAAVVGSQRIQSVARTAAQTVREVSAGGDPQALGRFLRSFTEHLEIPAPPAGPGRPASPLPPRPR
jgi:hypothetical protein